MEIKDSRAYRYAEWCIKRIIEKFPNMLKAS